MEQAPANSSNLKHWILPGVLLACGIWIWFELISENERSLRPIILVGIVACISAIPGFNRWFDSWKSRVESLLAAHPCRTIIAVIAAAGIGLLWHAWQVREYLFLKWHDEHVYMIQARMLAHGSLWTHPYPDQVAPFFDSFYLITDRVYAAMYFPGTALALVPVIWLGLPGWVMPMILCIAAAALVFAIARELFGPIRASIAVLALISVSGFRFVSITVFSEAPFLVAQLTIWWAWMRWRRATLHSPSLDESERPIHSSPRTRPVVSAVEPGEDRSGEIERREAIDSLQPSNSPTPISNSDAMSGPAPTSILPLSTRGGSWNKRRGSFLGKGNGQWRWIWLMGLAMGYAAITRPVDALCFALPVLVAIVWDLRQQISVLKRVAWRIAVAILPFLALQIIQNIGVTGIWNIVPESYYIARHYPAPALGFHAIDPGFLKRPATPIEHEFLQWVVMFYRGHKFAEINFWGPRRISEMLLLALATPVLAILLPLAIPSLREPKRIAIAASLALFTIAYLANVFNLTLYMAPAIVPIIFLLMMGWETLARDAGPNGRFVNCFMTLGLVGLCVLASDRNRREPVNLSIYLPQERVNRLIVTLKQPSVMLFRFDPGYESFENEPVYNDDVAWPDDARVIRAHDLGDVKNRDLYAYYGRKEPDRIFYRYDPMAEARGNDPLARLGTARELAHNFAK